MGGEQRPRSPSGSIIGSLARQLSAHVAAYALLLTGLAWLVPLDGSFGGDDGAYGGQVVALRAGGWALDRPLPVVADGNEGWLNTAITPDGPLPYTTNPGYVVLLDAVADVTVPSGGGGRAADLAPWLHLVPLAGALASATVAWALARAVTDADRPAAAPLGSAGPGSETTAGGAAALAFWLVALGPVVVNATTLWAHTLSTALAGLSLLLLHRLATAPTGAGPTTTWLVLALGTSSVAVAVVRTEAIFWLVALAVTAAVAIRHRPARLVAAGVAIGAGAMAWAINRSVGAALRADQLPIETSVVAGDSGGWVAGRFTGAWRLLLTSLGGGIGPVVALLATAIAVYAAVRLRRDPSADDRLPAILLAAAAGLYLVHGVVAAGETVSGLVAAWPIVLVLLVAKPAAWLTGEQRITLVLPAGLLTAAVLATQYAISGGHQWGGRYLSMAIVPIAVAAAVRGLPLLTARATRLPLAALLVAPALLGMVVSQELHARHRDLAEATTAVPAQVVVTEHPALTRIAWTQLPIAYYRADDDSLAPLLADLAAAGVATVNVHGFVDVPIDGLAGYRLTADTPTIRHLQLTD